MRILRLLGKALVFCATLAMLAGVCLFLTGAYLATYPLMRKSRFHARREAIAQLAVSLFSLAQTLQVDADAVQDPDSGDASDGGAPSESR